MLKCPACGRSGGPFRLRHQVHADGQLLRSWSCPCGNSFHASAGAERTANPQAPYIGFSVDGSTRSQEIRLQRIGKHNSAWSFGPYLLEIAGPLTGPGARIVTLLDGTENVIGEWRLEPEWGPGEMSRRIKGRALPPELEPDMLARVLVRLLN